MKTYTAAELIEILRNHSDWYCGRPNGCRADLRDADLCGADLRDANLRDADLRGADLCYANLCGANLRDADLCYANLRDADLCYANLCGADLRDADLCYANLRDADLRDANLRDADLRGANLRDADLRDANLRDADLRGANLRDADLRDAKYNERTAMYALACPEVGSFIGWKKANGHVVKLEITEDALRSSATTRKCRCSKARVLAIEKFDGTLSDCTAVQSDHDPLFVYEVGKVVEVSDFDTNRWNECAPGIHFFITRQEAVNY